MNHPVIYDSSPSYLNAAQQLIQQQESLWSQRLIQDLRVQVSSLHGHLNLLHERAQLRIGLDCVLSTGATTTTADRITTRSSALIERSHGAALSADASHRWRSLIQIAAKRLGRQTMQSRQVGISSSSSHASSTAAGHTILITLQQSNTNHTRYPHFRPNGKLQQ